MKSNWIKSVAIVASLVAGTIGNSAFAGNKGGLGLSGAAHSFQGGNTTARSIGSTQTFKPQIQTLNGNGLQGVQLQSRQHSPSFNVPQINNAVQGIQLKNNLDLSKKLGGVVGNSQLPFNPNLTKKIDGAFGKPQLPFNPDLNKKIIPAILDHKCLPGCNPVCSPCKIGCKPWWWGCYAWCYPTYKVCYPVVYTQPIVVQVPVATQVVVEQPLMQVPLGATLTLQSPNLGGAAGQVVLQIDKAVMPAMINEWRPDAVTATLPTFTLAAPQIAEIVLVRADGTVANTIKVELINAQPQQQAQLDAGGAAAAMAGLPK